MRKNNRIPLIVFFIGIISILILPACQGPTSGTNYQQKYYKGYDSLEMKFASESPPYRFYYDSLPGTVNELPIVVEIKNKGASYAFGALYLHGYDPHIMQVAGGILPTRNGISFGYNSQTGQFNIGFGQDGVYIGVSGGGYTGTSTNVGFRYSGTGSNTIYYGSNVFSPTGSLTGFQLTYQNALGSNLMQGVFTLMQGNLGWNAPIALEGETEISPAGGIQIYDFPTLIYYLPPSLEEFRQPIMATACFSYETQATAMLCLDPRPNNNNKKVCRALGVSLGGGQGGPISVTRIDQQPGNRKVVFTINIHHNKRNTFDEVWDFFQLQKCNPEAGQIVKQTDKNVVYVDHIYVSNTDIKPFCTPVDKIRLDDSGNGQITCTYVFDGATLNAYEAPVEINLFYGYSRSIFTNVLIKRV